jgi:predicted phage-related endonuclease
MHCQDICKRKKTNLCCHECPDADGCPDCCGDCPEECGRSVAEGAETNLVAFTQQHMTLFQEIRSLVLEKKAAEAREKNLKDELKAAMEAHGIRAIDNDILKITYVPETVTHTLDTAKIKRKYPGLAEECSKETPKSSYIKIEVKER